MYELTNVLKKGEKYPNSFLGKPTSEEIEQLKEGDLVLLGFQEGKGSKSVLERKFVRITQIKSEKGFEGILAENIFRDNPYVSNETQLKTVKEGDVVCFKDEHIWRIG